MIRIETGFTGTTYPLTTPRIGAYPISGTVSVSSEVAGFEGINANNELTWTFWKPTAVPANWILTFPATNVSYCGIASHNIGSVGGTVAFQRWDGITWVNMAIVTPTDDSPILFLTAVRSLDQVRIRLSNAIPTIGVIWIGSVLEFPEKCVWTGSIPFNEAVTDVYTDNVSDGGHVLDRFKTRKAGSCTMTVNNLSEAWAAANLPALRAHMGGLPVFMADRPEVYSDSVVYGSQAEPLRAERTKPVLGAARTVQFNIMANQPI